MATYNLALVRQLVRNRLDDTDFETEFLDTAINDAQWSILEGLNLTLTETTATLTLTAGTSSVTLPTDISGEPLIVRASSATQQEYDITDKFLDFEDFQQRTLNPSNTSASIPYWWTRFGDKMIFQTNATEDFTITVYYNRAVPALTLETDVPVIPERFQNLLKIGAYMEIAKREDDYDVKQQEERDYALKRQQLIRAYSRNRGPGRKHVMRVMGR